MQKTAQWMKVLIRFVSALVIFGVTGCELTANRPPTVSQDINRMLGHEVFNREVPPAVDIKIIDVFSKTADSFKFTCAELQDLTRRGDSTTNPSIAPGTLDRINNEFCKQGNEKSASKTYGVTMVTPAFNQDHDRRIGFMHVITTTGFLIRCTDAKAMIEIMNESWRMCCPSHPCKTNVPFALRFEYI